MRRGDAGVQDEGSQLVALALAAAPLGGGPDTRWLDLCAGPGGKAALLAGLGAERGAALTAVEVSPVRAGLVRAAVDGAVPVRPRWWWPTAATRGGRPATATASSSTSPAPGSACCGGGRSPAGVASPDDVARLAPLQRELLRSALAAVRPGGVVGYATCSPHPAETDIVVADVLRGRDDVEQLDARACLPGVPDLGPGPALRLWPHLHGTDGMYLALLRRR